MNPSNPPLGLRCKGTLCFNTPRDEAFLFISTFRGGLAIAEAREISINSCASAVGEIDGSMLDFYRTISLYGGTFLLPVNMYLSKLGPICFQETRLEIDIRPAWQPDELDITELPVMDLWSGHKNLRKISS
ncbi:hypothetical protein NC653_015977 [Populus alba x Populus x berolinensis]|uniref:Uncharacterized protein n=1 Tax=Populus alba x Populus x berolinensis TaxID=444605 RepID=A0AAD6QLQ0_9ROSI|nr:hypothetical protein NC653_015968 [Populus alba x Populus x berolinensis]KAJ6992740.1 hypothetical protein NC653_015977 [Populus alba x Populus x berolinensis]